MNSKSNAQNYDHFFVARQPIFHENGTIWGYELLFRSGIEYNMAHITDQDLATFSVATSGFIRSQEDLDQSKKICINFPETLLMQGAPHGLPSTVTVIEVLEDILPSASIVEQLIQYKQEGYLIAIDDFVGRTDIKEFIDIADIVKVDVLNKSADQIAEICAVIGDSKALRLAEKVEHRELIPHLKKLGFTLFQGYYFAKPELLTGRKIGTTEISKLRTLQAIEDPSITSREIENVIAADPSITYRLLRFLNSAAFGFSMRIGSIRQAITLLGLKRLRNWLRMLVLSDLLGKKSQELYAMALNRGKLLEELVHENQIQGDSAESMFLFGMLSLIDAMLDTPMEKLLGDLPVPDKVKQGYTQKSSQYNQYLQLATALEKSSAEDIKYLCDKLKLNEQSLAQASIRSILWANSMCQYL